MSDINLLMSITAIRSLTQNGQMSGVGTLIYTIGFLHMTQIRCQSMRHLFNLEDHEKII